MAKAAGGVVFDRVSKRYGKLTVVDDVSFTVAPGELVTLLGPSGCGKTTTLRMVAGLEPVTSGRIAIGGTDVTLRAANERDVSMVFQSYALFPHMTVLENVCYGPLSTSSDKAKARALAHAKLEMLGLAGLGDRLPSELSGGQQQRVAVARSLVLEPAVLLFDEPLSNLDAKLRRRVRQEIRDLQQSLDAHGDLRDARSGGGARRVRPHHRDGERAHRAAGHAARALRAAARAAFSPTSSATPIWSTASSWRMSDGREFAAGGARMPVRADGIAPGPATLAVRPNRLRLAHPRRAACRACAKRAAYLGSRIEYLVDTPWGELLVFDADAREPRGARREGGRDFRPRRCDRSSALAERPQKIESCRPPRRCGAGCVRGREVEIEIRQRKLVEVVGAGERPLRALDLARDLPVRRAFELRRRQTAHVGDRGVHPGDQFREALSLSSIAGGSDPDSRALVPRAKSLAICTCCVSGNMSGNKRALRSVDSSIFFAAACAAAFSRMAFKLPSIRRNCGTES